jgi:hypothetical protein
MPDFARHNALSDALSTAHLPDCPAQGNPDHALSIQKLERIGGKCLKGKKLSSKYQDNRFALILAS